MVHIYKGILLSHKKEPDWVSCREVFEPGACYTEWSKSGRKTPTHGKYKVNTPIQYINAYIWNLEGW